MGGSPSATQAISRYAVCDVTYLTCCGQRLYTVVFGISLTTFKN